MEVVKRHQVSHNIVEILGLVNHRNPMEPREFLVEITSEEVEFLLGRKSFLSQSGLGGERSDLPKAPCTPWDKQNWDSASCFGLGEETERSETPKKQ